MHKCPNCGKLTEGTYSEGGILFALCSECYQKLYAEGYKSNSRQERRNK